MSEVASQILEKTSPPPETKVETGAVSTEANPQSSSQDGKVSSKLEVLIRREQEARFLELEARKRMADVEARQKEIEAREQRLKEFESAKTSNSSKALELLGMNYDELTQSQLKDGQIPPEVQIKRIEDQFKQFQTKQEEEKSKQQEEAQRRAKEQEEQAIKGFKSEITTYLSDNKARYELIDFEGQHDLVFEVIDEHYRRTLDPETGIGKVMKIQEAADKVEQWLEDKYNRSRETSKVKALWSAVPKSAIEQAVKSNTKPVQQSPRTLTNNLSSQQTPMKRATPLSDQERVERAIQFAREKGFAQ